MGDVHNRGTKDQPMWYCRYIDTDGKRKHRPTHQPTKALATLLIDETGKIAWRADGSSWSVDEFLSRLKH